MSDWIMINTPIVSKRTGTVVREFGLKSDRNITMKQVSPGPNAPRAKYSRIEVVRNNGEIISTKFDDIALGAHQETKKVKVKGLWKKVISALRTL